MAHARFTPDLDLDGLSPDEAFAILGNDIRLEVIRVLWRADAAHEFDDGLDTVEPMSYSELQEAVGIDDNGKLNYHLSQLAPHFVRRSDDGYRLSGAGKEIARTVIAVTGADRVDFSSELDANCPLCEARIEATYEDQWLRIRCTACAGLFGDEAPAGTLFLTTFPAAGLTSRNPDEALAAGLYRCALDITYLLYGICRECAGPISSSLTVCEAHERAGTHPCETCGTPFPVWADVRCESCKFAKRLPVEMFATGLVMATGLAANQELDIHTPTFDEAIDLLQHRVGTTRSTDPLHVSVTMHLDAAAVTVTLDAEMNVVDLERTDSADVPTP